MANILTCPIPENTNPLSPNGFRFTIEKLPELEYFCQEINIPGITLGDPIFATPFRSIPVPGDMLSYDTLNIKFLVSGDMENYIAIYNWIVALGFPESYEQYVNYISQSQLGSLGELAKNYSVGTMQVLTNTNTPLRAITIHDLFPVSLGSLTFTSTNQDVQYLVGDATFRFSYYTFD